MKAIEFASQLIRRIDQSDLPAVEQRVLLSIAGGSVTCHEIAEKTALSSSACQAGLLKLEKMQYIRRVKGKKYYNYHLSQLGEVHIRTLLSFIPFQHE